MNRQRFDLQADRNESLEKTTNILALRMMHKPTQPALIFSNWDKLDDEMKNYIIYSAHKKTKMIKSHNVVSDCLSVIFFFFFFLIFKLMDMIPQDVDSETHLHQNFLPSLKN